MKAQYWILSAVFAWTLSAAPAGAADLLGAAANFAVLGGSTVTNIGVSVINGDLGSWPASAVVRPPPVTVSGTLHWGDEVAMHAQRDVALAYDTLDGMTPARDLSGQSLSGMTLTPGVYSFWSEVELTGPLTLDAQNNPDPVFVFQIHSALTTASNSSVAVINGGDECNLYWLVSRSVILGEKTAFRGSILAKGNITMHPGATINNGRALARSGAVRLDGNTITAGPSCPNPFTTNESGSWGQVKSLFVSTP